MSINMKHNIIYPTASHLYGLRALWKQAFGDSDEFLDSFFETAFSAKRCRCIIVNDEVAAALYWFDCYRKNEKKTNIADSVGMSIGSGVSDDSCVTASGEKWAYIYAVATLLQFRGQGLCHKLMEDVHIHLKKEGYAGTILVPDGKELFSFYEGIGYQICSSITELHSIVSMDDVTHKQKRITSENEMESEAETEMLKSASLAIGSYEKTSFRKIDKTEYAALRRRLLPIGGLIQENETLDFLEAQLCFYFGEGILLAAYAEEGVLHGAELLGDITKAEDIVSSLGCREGHFRVVGNETPFTMWCPFYKESKKPTHFGLALD